MKMKIDFNCDNDAFADCPAREVARTLHELADRIEKLVNDSPELDVLEAEGLILDYNGSIVGKWSLGD